MVKVGRSQEGLDGGAPVRSWDTVRRGDKIEIFVDPQGLIETVGLGYVPQASPYLPRMARHIQASNSHTAGGGPHHGCQDIEQGGTPRTVRTDQPKAFSGSHAEVDVGESRDVFVGLG